MFQNLNFKISDIFRYIMEKYLHKITFVFSKNVYFRNCGTFKIILVWSTQRYVNFFLTAFGRKISMDHYFDDSDNEFVSKSKK